MRWELVIFDCDGVLVDTEPAGNRALAALLTEIGLPTSYEQCVLEYKGRSLSSCLELIEAKLGRPPPSDFADRYRARVFGAFRNGLAPVPGVVEALDAIQVPVCVASSGEHEKMRASLGAAKLLDRFEGRMFSATEIARGKPAPELFLYAARCMQARPGACAVVEDSALGVAAALAAGMTPFGFAGTQAADASALARAGARIFSDMRELPALLEEGGGRIAGGGTTA